MEPVGVLGSSLFPQEMGVSCGRIGELQPERTPNTNSSEFMEKARAPLATEEFERILRIEREHWSSCMSQELSRLAKTTNEIRQEVSADRSEGEALRASFRDLRAEAELSSATSAARLAVLEATVSELQEAVRAEREQRRDDVQRHAAELAAARRGAQEGAGRAAAAAEGLRADVARLQSSVVEVSEGLERAGASAELANQRIADLALTQSQAHDRIAVLDDTQTKALAAQGTLRAEGTAASRAVQELQAEVKRLSDTSSLAGHKAYQSQGSGVEDLENTRPCTDDADASPSGAAQLFALRSEVLSLKAVATQQGQRVEILTQDVSLDVANLTRDFRELKLELESTKRRLDEMDLSLGDDSASVKTGSLQRLVQDQRRELTFLSGELSSIRDERREHLPGRAGPGGICQRLAEIERRIAVAEAQDDGTPQPSASLANSAPLPTLLAQRASAEGCERQHAAAAPHAAPQEKPSTPAERRVPAGLKDSLEGVVAAVQKVLHDEDAHGGRTSQSTAHGASASMALPPGRAAVTVTQGVAAQAAPPVAMRLHRFMGQTATRPQMQVHRPSSTHGPRLTAGLPSAALPASQRVVRGR